MKDDLQKSDSCGLKSERKKILTSSTCSLACLSTNLGAFCPMVVHLPSEKSILLYFSGPRGVAILDCDSHSQAGSTSWRLKKSSPSSPRPLSAPFLFRTSGKGTDMATPLGPEKYGRIDFSLGRWTTMGQNAPKLELKHAKEQVELVRIFYVHF